LESSGNFSGAFLGLVAFPLREDLEGLVPDLGAAGLAEGGVLFGYFLVLISSL
jgi:hypothetical protein